MARGLQGHPAPAEGSPAASLRDWGKQMAERALRRVEVQPRSGRQNNREKEFFALRAQYVKALLAGLETLASSVNREAEVPLLRIEKSLNPKNLGGIEVPDGARLVLRFLERRLEVVVHPLAHVAGQPVPLGTLAGASVIQYDASDPAGADWFDLTLREDGCWERKGVGTLVGEKELRELIEWLVS